MIDRGELKRLQKLGRSELKLGTPLARPVTLAGPVTGYCVKCRTKKEMVGPRLVTLKNNRLASQGTCPTCGTKMFKIRRKR